MSNISSSNKRIIPLFAAFTLLYFIIDNVAWPAFYRFEDIFNPLIPEPHDWEDYSYVENLDFWGNWLSWAGHISTIIGLAVWMFIPQRFINDKTYNICFIASACLSVVSIIVMHFTVGITAFISVIGATLFGASALGLLLWQVTRHITPVRVGLFVACVIQTKYLISDLFVRPYFWDALPLPLLTALLCVCAIGAGIAGILARVDKAAVSAVQTLSGDKSKTPADGIVTVADSRMPRAFLIILILAIFMSYVIFNVANDQLFAFMDAYWEIEHFFLYLVILSYPLTLFAGWLFDKSSRTNGFLIGTLCAGVNLALVLFFEEAQFFGAVGISVFYLVLRDFAGIILSTVTIAAPIYYTVRGNRYIPPQIGFIAFSICAFTVPLIFDATRPVMDVIVIFDEQFNPILGIALLLTFAALTLVFALISVNERHLRTVAFAAVAIGKVDKNNSWRQIKPAQVAENAAPAASEIRKKLAAAALEPLSPRELEVAELTILGIKRKIIADTLFIQSSTVDSHRISIYNKFGVHTRDELLKALNIK